MKMIFLVLILTSRTLLAQTSSVDHHTFLKYGLSIDQSLSGISQVQTLFNKAINLVADNPILGNYSIQPTDNFNHSDFIIQLTNSSQALKNDGHPELLQFSKMDGDGYSIFFAERPNHPVLVRIFWDKIVSEKVQNNFIERSDAFTRLVTMLGHEIYGNVVFFKQNAKAFSNNEFRTNSKLREAMWLKSELNAFTKGKMFLESLLRNFGSILSPKMTKDMQAALARETEMLESYNKKWCEYVGFK